MNDLTKPKVIEASEIGLPPGVWPGVLEHEGKTWTRGSVDCDREGEVQAVHYRCYEGSDLRRLVVLND